MRQAQGPSDDLASGHRGLNAGEAGPVGEEDCKQKTSRIGESDYQHDDRLRPPQDHENKCYEPRGEKKQPNGRVHN